MRMTDSIDWQPIQTFKSKDHKHVVVWIETADPERGFAAIAKARAILDGGAK